GTLTRHVSGQSPGRGNDRGWSCQERARVDEGAVDQRECGSRDRTALLPASSVARLPELLTRRGQIVRRPAMGTGLLVQTVGFGLGFPQRVMATDNMLQRAQNHPKRFFMPSRFLLHAPLLLPQLPPPEQR